MGDSLSLTAPASRVAAGALSVCILLLTGCAAGPVSGDAAEFRATVAALEYQFPSAGAYCLRLDGRKPPRGLVNRMRRLGRDVQMCGEDRVVWHFDLRHRGNGVYRVHVVEDLGIEGYGYSYTVAPDAEGRYRVTGSG